jgi:ethanolaminephosphotransferase
VILTASALNLGLDWWTVASLTATTANFYLTTWEEFHTGTLFLSAFSGPVEGILLVVALFATTGFVGSSLPSAHLRHSTNARNAQDLPSGIKASSP